MKSCPPGREGIEATLERLAKEVAGAVRRRRPLADRWWDAAGIRVRQRQMRARGRCDTSLDGAPTVFVRAGDNPYAQGFTVAHEVAHLLLDHLPIGRRRELNYGRVERLCDEFAQSVIVPPATLAVELGSTSTPPLPAEVLRLCGLFEANPSVMLRSLERQIPLERDTYLLARLRGHYRRPAAVEFRVDTTAGGGRLFWPQHIRLSKLGLAALAIAAERASHGTALSGTEAKVMVPLARLDRETEDNAMAGPVYWQAVRQGKDAAYLLALIDCRELRGIRVRGKRTVVNTHPAAQLDRAASS